MSDEIIGAIIGACATLLATWLAVRWNKSREQKLQDPKISSSREALSKKKHQYDVFVSAPMAGFATDADLAADHERIEPVVGCPLRRERSRRSSLDKVEGSIGT